MLIIIGGLNLLNSWCFNWPTMAQISCKVFIIDNFPNLLWSIQLYEALSKNFF